MRQLLTMISRPWHRPAAVVAAVVLPLWAALASAGPGASPLPTLQAMGGEAEALLRQGVTGRKVQSVQQDIIQGLDALIAACEAGEPMGAGEPGKQAGMKVERLGAATGAPRKPAKESVLPPGEWRYGRMRERAELEEAWMPALPEAERKKVTEAFQTGRLPRRYEELLREYNKRLAEESAVSDSEPGGEETDRGR